MSEEVSNRDSPLHTRPWLEAVREKPGMYLGGTDERALHECVNELLHNSVDEFLAGRCTRVQVTLHDDGTASVADNGPGISIAVLEGTGLPAIELNFTILRTTAKYQPPYQYSGGAVGAKCVNALSEWFRVETRRDGNAYAIEFERGQTTGKLRMERKLEPGEESGTRIEFKPDALIFQTTRFDPERIRARLREIAFCHPALEVSFLDESSRGELERFRAEAVFAEITGAKRARALTELITLAGEENGIRVRAVFRYVKAKQGIMMSFVNTGHTPEGGAHVCGLLDGIAQALTTAARRSGLLMGRGGRVKRREAIKGIVGAVVMLHPAPQFEGPCRWKLVSPDAAKAVRRIASKALGDYFVKHPRAAVQILAAGNDEAPSR